MAKPMLKLLIITLVCFLLAGRGNSLGLRGKTPKWSMNDLSGTWYYANGDKLVVTKESSDLAIKRRKSNPEKEQDQYNVHYTTNELGNVSNEVKLVGDHFKWNHMELSTEQKRGAKEIAWQKEGGSKEKLLWLRERPTKQSKVWKAIGISALITIVVGAIGYGIKTVDENGGFALALKDLKRTFGIEDKKDRSV